MIIDNICTLYIIYCTMYLVHCILYNVHCAYVTISSTYNFIIRQYYTYVHLQCTMFICIICILYSVQYTYSVQCTPYIVHCTLYNVQYTYYTYEHCTLYRVHMYCLSMFNIMLLYRTLYIVFYLVIRSYSLNYRYT